MTVVTSFDVGIKNLAYCTLSYDPTQTSGYQFPINDWNVIDLIDSSQLSTPNPICQQTVRSSSVVCTHPAHYQTFNCDQVSVKKLCKLHSKPYIVGETIRRLYTVTNTELDELTGLMCTKLDAIDFTSSKYILIEVQPDMATQKMKDFSKILMGYFMIRYFADKRNPSVEVKFINASNKLSVYDGPYIECSLKKQYLRNKFYGKQYCQYLLRYNSKWIDFFSTFAKKDDLADCFLQGAWYLMNNNLFSSLQLSEPNSTPIPIKISIPFHIADADADTDKIKISLKPLVCGQDKLKEIKGQLVTRQVLIDINLAKYKKLRRGYKPKLNAVNYTLSNIKYLYESGSKNEINSAKFTKAIEFYFDNIDNFKKNCFPTSEGDHKIKPTFHHKYQAEI